MKASNSINGEAGNARHSGEETDENGHRKSKGGGWSESSTEIKERVIAGKGPARATVIDGEGRNGEIVGRGKQPSTSQPSGRRGAEWRCPQQRWGAGGKEADGSVKRWWLRSYREDERTKKIEKRVMTCGSHM
jgi:hypothetical protein